MPNQLSLQAPTGGYVGECELISKQPETLARPETERAGPRKKKARVYPNKPESTTERRTVVPMPYSSKNKGELAGLTQNRTARARRGQASEGSRNAVD